MEGELLLDWLSKHENGFHFSLFRRKIKVWLIFKV